MAEKVCKKCREFKEANADNFYKHPSKPGEFEASCKVCRNAGNANRKKRRDGGSAPQTKSSVGDIRSDETKQADREALIRQRQERLTNLGKKTTPAGETNHSGSPAKPAKRAYTRKVKPTPAGNKLESDRLISEMTEISETIKQAKVELRNKCLELAAALEQEGHV